MKCGKASRCQRLVERLEGFASREYSIASLPASGRMELLVRKAVKDDGSLGLGSGWLTRDAGMGEVVKLRLRPNPNFHPPADGPQILIGAGTGIAGLRAHLLYRQWKNLRGAWLLFGERSRASDLYYAEDLAAPGGWPPGEDQIWYSRATSLPRNTVQHLVAEQGAEIARQVEAGALRSWCVWLRPWWPKCAALIVILGEDRLEQMTQNGLLPPRHLLSLISTRQSLHVGCRPRLPRCGPERHLGRRVFPPFYDWW